jgi:hypothetical protein
LKFFLKKIKENNIQMLAIIKILFNISTVNPDKWFDWINSHLIYGFESNP